MNWLNWLHKFNGDARFSIDEDRWVVLDVETSGLDPQSDRLLAIAAIALRVDWAQRRLAVHLADSFEVVLWQQEVSIAKDNILLHGIGVQRQREGLDPAQALAQFSSFVGRSPLLAFHAAFDQAMIDRSMKQILARKLANPWLDIEHLCAVTHDKVRARSLDEWMLHFGIECAVRHQAAADTLAECELLQRIWPQVSRECGSWQQVDRLARQRRWVAHG